MISLEKYCRTRLVDLNVIQALALALKCTFIPLLLTCYCKLRSQTTHLSKIITYFLLI